MIEACVANMMAFEIPSSGSSRMFPRSKNPKLGNFWTGSMSRWKRV